MFYIYIYIYIYVSHNHYSIVCNRKKNENKSCLEKEVKETTGIVRIQTSMQPLKFRVQQTYMNCQGDLQNILLCEKKFAQALYEITLIF